MAIRFEAANRAGGVVYRNSGKERLYLLIRSKDKTQWVLPKGHIEHGETVEEAAVREVLEEAGVLAKIEAPLPLCEYDKDGERVKVQFYLMEYVSAGETAAERETRWLALHDAIDLTGVAEIRSVLHRVE